MPAAAGRGGDLSNGRDTHCSTLVRPGEASRQQEAVLAGGRNGLPSSREEQKEEGGDRWVWMKRFAGTQEV